jgi:hypothetical protein
MINDLFRLGLLSLIGMGLILVTTSYLTFLYREFVGAGSIVIEPFTIVGEDGKEDTERGKALAQALQGRLQTLVSELRQAEDQLAQGSAASETLPGADVPPRAVPGGVTGAQIPASNPLISPRLNSLKTGLFESIDFKLSVAGLEVGGMMPWLQRRVFSRRTLHFAVFMQKGLSGTKGISKVFGSVDALGLESNGLRLEVQGDSESAPPPAKVADQLAHELVRLYLAQDTTSKFRLMEPEDFVRLAAILVDVAKAQQKPLLSTARSVFITRAPELATLADKTPTWPELNYFAGWVSDTIADTNKALLYYGRAQLQFSKSGRPQPAKWIEQRIADLTTAAATAGETEPGAAQPPSIDFSRDVRIRDGGTEGSVVGQALAIALELQIIRATGQQQPISARYIYYEARRREGTPALDAGAQIKDGIAVLEDPGAVAEDVWPYKPGEFMQRPPPGISRAKRFRITEIRQLKTLADVKRVLKDGGAVVLGIAVFQNFVDASTAKTGVVPMPKANEQLIGGHAVVAVGYDDAKQWLKFANSWGTAWGDHGFGYLPYDFAANRRFTTEAWSFMYQH